MSTGDLNGNVQRLVRELRSIKYPGDVDEVGLRLGDPVALLPLLSFTLLKFSRHVARYIVRNGFELAGKTDQRFVETSFRLLRDLLNVRTVLTPAQFFEQGFAERKVLLLCDVITVCKKLHNDEVRHERLAALKATRQEQVISRLATPHGGQQEPPSGGRHAAGRRSPVVKVVRNDDVELLQVLAPTHQPNATDGAQSVFRTRKTISRSPSPSPPNAVTMRAGARPDSTAWWQQSAPTPAVMQPAAARSWQQNPYLAFARASPTKAAPQAPPGAASTQQRPGVGAGLGRAAPAASEGAGHGGQDWAVKLRQLEQETQQQVQQLRERLAATEAELEKCRSEARQARETLQAQVTVLEGRVRFLECEMELCVKRQPTPARPAAAGDGFGDSALYGASGAAARASPGAGGRVTAGLTPMPQPSFSFQPSSLMQQVAASAAAAPGEGPAPAQELAPAPPQAHGQRLMSSSVDSGATAGRRHGAAGAAGALGAGGNQHPASAGQPGTGTGGSAGGGAYRSTDDLINSLYVRYTEAQDFLQSIRRR
eukprot:XP_001701969.1 predicted protein [Chlamydomonas reinhardtii]